MHRFLGTKFCTMAPNIFGIIIVVPSPNLTYKNVDQFTCTEQKAPDNSEVHMALQNCESSAWSFLHFTPQAPRIQWRLDFWRTCVHCVSVNSKQYEIRDCDSSTDADLSLLGCKTMSIGKCFDHTVSNPWRWQSAHFSHFLLYVRVDTEWGVGCCWCRRCKPWYYIQNGLLVGTVLLVKLAVCIQEVIVMLFI